MTVALNKQLNLLGEIICHSRTAYLSVGQCPIPYLLTCCSRQAGSHSIVCLREYLEMFAELFITNILCRQQTITYF